MLDASNPESSQKAKKAKVQTVRPVERFWPDAIASLQPRASGHNGTGSAPSPGDAPASGKQFEIGSPLPSVRLSFQPRFVMSEPVAASIPVV